MAREKEKKVTLRAVEEQPEPPAVVIRLGKEKEPEDTHPPVRIGPAKPMVEIPAAGDSEARDFRSHQPDIDDLIDKPHSADQGDEEVAWGEEARIRIYRPWGWFALAGLVLTGGVLWSLRSLKESEKVEEIVRAKAQEAIIDETAEVREAEDLVNGIESAIRSYFTASTIESRLRWIRFPERTAPLMRAYEQAHPVKPSPLQSLRVLQPLPIENHTDFWMASVVLASGARHELIIEITEKGPKIDWETMVKYQPMPWDQFATKRPDDRSFDFRVYAQPDTFYSHEFQDETQWACYRLTAPDAEEVLFGYVRRGSETEAEIAPLTGGIRHASLVLRLQIPPGLKSPKGVVMEKVVSPRWLHITPPDQQN